MSSFLGSRGDSGCIIGAGFCSIEVIIKGICSLQRLFPLARYSASFPHLMHFKAVINHHSLLNSDSNMQWLYKYYAITNSAGIAAAGIRTRVRGYFPPFEKGRWEAPVITAGPQPQELLLHVNFSSNISFMVIFLQPQIYSGDTLFRGIRFP